MFLFESVGYGVLYFLLFSLFYSIKGFIGSFIPVNARYLNDEGDYDVWVISNGVHADFFMPAINKVFDWSKIIPSDDYTLPIEKGNYIGLGWGDKGFYLEIPTWADLTFKVAFTAIFLPSPTLMHVKSVKVLPTGEKYFYQLSLNEKQYLGLCRYISSYFKIRDGEVIPLKGVGYSENDNFFKARGKYHLYNTCNFWINRGLMKAGVRTPLWCPIDKGIFYQLDKIPNTYNLSLVEIEKG